MTLEAEDLDGKLKVFYDLYDRRKSVREFADRPVEAEKLNRLISVLHNAQSAANRQPWHFIVLIDDDGRARIMDVLTKDGFKNAPVFIVACADPAQAWVRKTDHVNYAWVDVSIALTEMIGAATAEGLGSCWIASLDAALVKKNLGIPDSLEVVAMVALGYPKEELKKEEKFRKPLQEIIHYGRWQG